jgi:hypothetical protein
MEFLGVVGTPHKKERSDSDPIWLPVQSNWTKSLDVLRKSFNMYWRGRSLLVVGKGIKSVWADPNTLISLGKGMPLWYRSN